MERFFVLASREARSLRPRKEMVHMGLNYLNLDDRTRLFMVEEIQSDVADNSMYISPRLTSDGQDDWPDLVRVAAQSYDDDWLAAQLRGTGRLRDTEQRRKRGGGYTTVQVPHTAPITLAEGEFNRYYARGLCRRAIDEEIAHVVVYRAKSVVQPRSASEDMIGAEFDPADILADLRSSTGVEPALGIPPGPNSGLTLRLP